MIIAEYVWLDVNSVVRSKTRVIHDKSDSDVRVSKLEAFLIGTMMDHQQDKQLVKIVKLLLNQFLFMYLLFQSIMIKIHI